MTFQEIFKEKGMYMTEGFIRGYCYEVDADGWLYSLQYKHINDISPVREHALIHREVFNRNFVPVFNRKQLFK